MQCRRRSDESGCLSFGIRRPRTGYERGSAIASSYNHRAGEQHSLAPEGQLSGPELGPNGAVSHCVVVITYGLLGDTGGPPRQPYG